MDTILVPPAFAVPNDEIPSNAEYTRYVNLAGVGTQNLDQVLTVGNNAGAKKIVNLADGTNPQDAVTLSQLEAVGTPTLSEVLTAGNLGGAKQIKQIADGTSDTDAATVGQLNAAIAAIPTPSLGEVLLENNNGAGIQIKNIGDGTDPTDAVTLEQLEAAAAPVYGTNEIPVGDGATPGGITFADFFYQPGNGGQTNFNVGNGTDNFFQVKSDVVGYADVILGDIDNSHLGCKMELSDEFGNIFFRGLGNTPIVFNLEDSAVSPVSVTLPAFDDDAAAGAGGLTVGMMYQTTGGGVLLVAGIVMVKQ